MRYGLTEDYILIKMLNIKRLRC